MKPLFASLLAVLLLGTSCSSFSEGAQQGAISIARRAIVDGRYDDALNRLRRAEGYRNAPAERQAEIIYLRAQSYEGLHRKADALGSYKFLTAHYPATSYAYQAAERIKELETK